MGMTPDQYFQTFVEPNFWDSYEHPGDIRRAFNAAVSASQAADQYFEYYNRHDPNHISQFKNLAEFINHLSHLSDNAFRDIRSIANVYKHLYSDAHSKYGVHSTVNSSGSIDVIKLSDDPDIAEFKEKFIEGKTPSSGNIFVVFTRKDGSRAELLPILRQAVDCLQKIIQGS